MAQKTAKRTLPKVGDSVFIFDALRRVYAKDDAGRPYGQPIYREYWVPRTVVSENRASLILENGMKIKKSAPNLNICLNTQELDDKVWLHEHRYTVERAVATLSDVAALKQIAVLAGLSLPDCDA